MKKKILSFILALFIFVPCVMALSACAPADEPPLTNAELAVVYKEVADSALEKIGVENPTEP